MDKKYSIEIRKIDETHVGEPIISGVKALVAAIPFVGGSLNSLMNDYIPDFKHERLKKIVEKIGNDVDEIKDSLNEEYIKTEEFAYYFEITLKRSLEEFNEEKIRYYIGFLIGNLDRNKQSNNDEKDFYLKLIEKLTPLQLKIIRFLKSPENYFDEIDIINQVRDKIPNDSFLKMLELAFNEVDIDILKKSFAELYTYGLTKAGEISFEATTMSRGFDAIHGKLNQIGERFIIFCGAYGK